MGEACSVSNGTIIYIGGFELPDKDAAAHRVLSNTKILRELNYKVVFIGVNKDLCQGIPIEQTKQVIMGFETWFIPYPNKNKEWLEYLTSIKAFCYIASTYSDIKAVICYNYQAVAFLKIISYSHKRDIKVIADCTEWYSTKGIGIVRKILKGLDTFLRMRIIQKNIDGIIVISRYLEDYYRRSKNVIRIPPLVDLEEEKWKQEVPIYADGKIHFVYAGSPGQYKDKLNLVVEALYELKELRNYIFYVIGITKEQYLIDYQVHGKLLEELKDNIHFLGRLQHTESLNYVKAADFNLFIRENTRLTKAGFPTKFTESVSCGTPVVTTKNSDLAEYIVDNENGYFLRPCSKQSLIEDMKRILLLDKSEVEKIRYNCININTFDYRNYIDPLGHFINSIINN